MVDEESCKILLEELGYTVKRPRMITEHNACVAIQMVMLLRRPHDELEGLDKEKLLFGIASRNCKGVGGPDSGTRWRQRYLDQLELDSKRNPHNHSYYFDRIAKVEDSIREHGGVQL